MKGWLRRWFVSYRDYVIIVAPVAAMLLLGALLDLSESFHAFAIQHERWQLDEIFPAFCIAGLLYMVLLVGRTRGLRHELLRRQRAEGEANQLARNDSLTGLANRRTLVAHIADRAARLAPATEISVFVLDLDRFKPVNDTYGHEGGDAVLVTIARRLEQLTGESGLVARIGGDEFACVLEYPAGSLEPVETAEAILALVARPVQLRGGLAEVSASVGLVTCASGASDAEEMLRAADFAMYHAKRSGRSNYCVFAAEIEAEMRERAELELDMHAGIHRGEFVPYFQPIVMLASGEMIGFEALARWNHPTRGLIGPDLFIPIAEDAGMIQDLGFAVLRRACIEARRWPQHLTLSVNISPLQLNDPWLPQRILQVLCTTGFAPARLIVEITETRLVEDIEAARVILLSLRNAGIQIALDDFGTGYASLKHLRELQFNRIKIDRSFVQDMRAGDNGQIVRAILSLSEGLGLPVTAEGIETDESAVLLAGLGCEFGQGFLYSHAVEAEAALEMARAAHHLGHDAPAMPPEARSATP
ncbi:putative bifunctional diguanylate cyclase/phosphodiesterase [Sphingomonas psychrotolerans]|uniref:GGDEF-domain containing protein n=1 Tax=Sphingomonas psychrotolerans TaxID=1327635 RepID=A0A2K8MHT2_9SPHN|nr:EAL domain-containing protein [Sphingomonas psychrotolerans]ATY32096.1 GGDEF-domain containing protein [Sphingomonas psychrotolerans]